MNTAQPFSQKITRYFQALWEAYLLNFKKYATFRGRSSRMAWWSFTLFNFIFSIILMIVDYFIFGYIPGESMPALTILFFLVTFIPGIALTVRRLHDTGRSGWWYGAWWIMYIAVCIIIAGLFFIAQPDLMANIIPLWLIIAYITLLVLIMAYSLSIGIIMGFFRSNPGENKYGPNPYAEKQADSAVTDK